MENARYNPSRPQMVNSMVEIQHITKRYAAGALMGGSKKATIEQDMVVVGSDEYHTFARPETEMVHSGDLKTLSI